MTKVHLLSGALHPPPGPCALQQHPRYGAAITALGGSVAQLRCQDATALILRRKLGPMTAVWLPRGPVSQDDAATAPILRALPRGFQLALPETPAQLCACRAAGFRAILTPSHVAELDLTPPAPARMAAQQAKWRNRLRRGLDGPLTVTHRRFDAATDAGLLDLEAAQRRARGYRALPPAFTLAFAATSPDAVRLFLAQDSGALAAFVIVLLHGPVATYHIGWTSAQGRRHGAHPLLLWQASNWLADAGYTRFDLGGLDTDHAPGLARFKLGTGAVARPLGPTILRLPSLTGRRRAA